MRQNAQKDDAGEIDVDYLRLDLLTAHFHCFAARCYLETNTARSKLEKRRLRAVAAAAAAAAAANKQNLLVGHSAASVSLCSTPSPPNSKQVPGYQQGTDTLRHVLERSQLSQK